MVHTFVIGQLFYSRADAIEIMHLFGFSQRSIDRFDINGFAKRDMGAVRKGIKNLTMTKCMEQRQGQQPQCIGYSFTIRMEPWLFITQIESIDIFECSEDNVGRLAEQFYEFVHGFTEDTAHDFLSNIETWSCRRIDYTHNIVFNEHDRREENQRDAETFYRLSKRTSLHQRTAVKRRRDEKMFVQSTAEGNLSNKAIFYDKRAQIEADFCGMDEDDLDDLMESAENVIRYELQCYKGKIGTIKNKYKLPDRSIVRLLDEGISNELLIKQYEKSVGFGDFYVLHRAKAIIDRSLLSNSSKTKLYQFMQLVSQARGLDKAREQFVAGTELKNSREHIVVQGSANTFRNRIKVLAELNINPVAIPRSGTNSRSGKVYDYPKELRNPICYW